MLTVSGINVKYGDRILLDHVDWAIKTRDKIGLVGRNGAGKSTLLKILSKELNPDEGIVSLPSSSRLGLLHQELHIEQNKTLLDETMTAFSELQKLNEEMECLGQTISTRTDYESSGYLSLLEKLSELTEHFAILGGATSEGDAVKVLKGLGFKDTDFSRKIHEFSGGWQMRVVLAKMLLQKPDFLLLDEPTNHLDIESIIWLEKFLVDYPGAVVIISHDQQFLDNCTLRTVEIELGKLHEYKAAYSKYLILRKERREKAVASFENQQRLIAQKEKTIKRFMAKATKTSMAQSMQKQLDKLERVEIESEDLSRMKLKFPPSPRCGEIVMDLQNIHLSYGSLDVLQDIDLRIERGNRIAFVGQNGQGKTTLAKILVEELKSDRGTKLVGHNVSIGYYAQNQAETLDRNLTLLETMEYHSPPEMRTSLRSILGAFLFSGEDSDKKVSVLSGGERARLSLACLLLKPFNFLLLDEPTNHLDIMAKNVLKQALLDYDGTLIVVSHDRRFLTDLTSTTLEFRDKKTNTYLGDINYFLEKRKLATMREVESSHYLSPSNEKSRQNLKASNLITSNKKENNNKNDLKRKIQNAEKKITRTENDIKNLERDMTKPGFYESNESQILLNNYRRKKDELAILYKKWETFQEKYDQKFSQ